LRVAMDAMGTTFTSGEILRVLIHAVREQNLESSLSCRSAMMQKKIMEGIR